MRLSIWPGAGQPYGDLLEVTAHAAETGWDGVYVADHFMPNAGTGSAPDDPVLECGSLVAALGAARAPAAGRHAGLRHHVPAPGGAGQHGRHRRPRHRRPVHARRRRGLAGQRARSVRHRAAAGQAAAGPVRRGAAGAARPAAAADDHGRRPVLPAHRRGLRAQAGPGSAADPHRRQRRAADAADRRGVRRRVEHLGPAGCDRAQVGGAGRATAPRSGATRSRSRVPPRR